jgi:hypothetical protein
LVYNLDANNNLVDKTPDFVLGQPNFTSSGSTLSQSGFGDQLTRIAYDAVNQRLFVPDGSNRRVLVFDVTTITNGEPAIHVHGQPDFTTAGTAVDEFTMNSPSSCEYDATNQRLFVGDGASQRVLVYNVSTITNGEAAVSVLGQPNFTNTANTASQAGTLTVRGLEYDAATNRLYVVQLENRISVFDVASITNGENAINVLGQSGFTTTTAATTINGLNGPIDAALDVSNQRLFVSDQGNQRVVMYNVSSISNGEDAIQVLGQTDFTTGTGGTSQSKLSNPKGVFFAKPISGCM